MRCKFFMAALAFAAILPASAQDNNLFNHLSVGVDLGTTGIGIDVAAPVGNYVQVRAGYNFVPTIKVKDIKVDISANQGEWNNIQTQANALKNTYYNALSAADKQKVDAFAPYMSSSLPQNMLVDGEYVSNNFKFLVDLYPFKKSSFHVTAGFFAGKSQIIDVYTTNCQDQLLAITYYNNNLANTTITPAIPGAPSYTFGDKIGAEIGDYLLTPNGNQIKGHIKTAGFKPYLGIGFGRAVPQKHRFSVGCDLGVMFWGTPEIMVEQAGGNVKLDKGGVDGDGGFVKTVSKVSVYPVASLRLCYRLF